MPVANSVFSSVKGIYLSTFSNENSHPKNNQDATKTCPFIYRKSSTTCKIHLTNCFFKQPLILQQTNQTISHLFCNTYKEQPGTGIGTPWRRLWKNA